MRDRRFLLSVVVLLAAIACTPQPPSPVGPSRAAEEVSAAMRHYVALTRLVNADSVAAMYTADGELLEPNMAPLRGPAAIRAFLAPFEGRTVVDSASVSSAPPTVYGPVAYQWGNYHQVTRVDGGAPTRFDGRFAAEWHREDDGRWRLRRILMQPALPPGALR